MTKAKILQKQDVYISDYPKSIEFAKKQAEHFWTEDEVALEKDLQDLLVNLSPAEKHGLITVLKLFTHYELKVGNEFWGKVITEMFPRPDIQRMANCFSFFEINVHAPFYDKINKLLHLDTEEFYNSYLDDPVLKSRMEHLDSMLDKSSDTDVDKLLRVAVFSMVEGAILYANFAFLKHFQAEGKNSMTNLVAGIDFSVRDEQLHSEAGSWLFRTLLGECQLSSEELSELHEDISQSAAMIVDHECRIIKMIFEKGEIDGITAKDMESFVKSRVDLCLQNLGMSPMYLPPSNPISDWFYLSTSATAVMHDFFDSQGSQYTRNWSESKLMWRDLD